MKTLKSFQQNINQESYETKIQKLINKEDYGSEVKINREIGHYQIKLAENLEEMCEAFALRHEVFFSKNKTPSINAAMDLDEFDLVADHLILKDTKLNKVIGTYRIIDSSRTDRFYSSGEFDLTPLSRLKGKCLELGRACIHPDYRTGTSIALVWQGIGEYMNQSGANWAFGCSSIPVDEIDEMYLVGAKLMKDFLIEEDYRIKPLKPSIHEKLMFKNEMNGNFQGAEGKKAAKLPPL